MSILTIDISDDEFRRLEVLAKHDGLTPGLMASDAVRARIAEEEAWDAQVREGLAESESGALIDYETFRAEIDGVVARLSKSQ